MEEEQKPLRKKKKNFFCLQLVFNLFYRAFIVGYNTPVDAQLGFCDELTFESEQSTHSGGQSPRERKQNWESFANDEEKAEGDGEESRSSAQVFVGCCCCCCCCGGGGGALRRRGRRARRRVVSFIVDCFAFASLLSRRRSCFLWSSGTSAIVLLLSFDGVHVDGVEEELARRHGSKGGNLVSCD